MNTNVCDENIMFDPRLQEYMNKKIYYKNNNIMPCIPLEMEYAITQEDLEKIKNYINPKQKINPYVQPDHHEPKIQYKQRVYDESLRKCNESKLNHFPSTKIINQKLDKHKDLPVFLSGHIKLPKTERQYATNECIDTLKQRYDDNKLINFNSDKNLTEHIADMQLGMPSQTHKSYGYDNPYEHYYDYIDEDIQDPNHIVLPFPRGGESARLVNKAQKPTYTREIMQ